MLATTWATLGQGLGYGLNFVYSYQLLPLLVLVLHPDPLLDVDRLPQDELAKIFDRFYRGDPARSAGLRTIQVGDGAAGLPTVLDHLRSSSTQ